MAVHDISLMGAVFPDVPKVILPVDGGGTATYTDVSDSTAVAADVAAGKWFYTSDGTFTEGTASGGGGGSVVISDTTDAAGGTIRTITATAVNMQSKTNINPTTSSQTIEPDNGYTGLSSVQINAMPTGTAGTPTATKGTVSNHSISVTPSVTNQTGYITGSTKTGTAVTVSASELVSGNKEITENGTNIDVSTYSTVSVAVPSSGSKNVQIVQSTTRTNSSSLTAISSELTVSKTGTYDVYWSVVRTNTSSSYTWGAQLYKNGAAYGTENTTWTNNTQNNQLTNISLTSGDKLRVYGRETRGTSYYVTAPVIAIVEQ